MNSPKSDEDIIEAFKISEKSAQTADDYAQLAREILNTINEYQGYSKEASKKSKLWASKLYYIAGDLIMDDTETGDQIKSWEYWQLSSSLEEE